MIKRIKRIVSVLLVLVSLISIISLSAYATNTVEDTDIIWLEDGSYIVVYTEIFQPRVANTVSGTKNYHCLDANDNELWTASLHATFAYSGAWYTCTTADCDVTMYASNWYIDSKNTTRSSNNAIANLTMGHLKSGVTIERIPITITLTCDSNGNLS